jgi:hypothetical protein
MLNLCVDVNIVLYRLQVKSVSLSCLSFCFVYACAPVRSCMMSKRIFSYVVLSCVVLYCVVFVLCCVCVVLYCVVFVLCCVCVLLPLCCICVVLCCLCVALMLSLCCVVLCCVVQEALFAATSDVDEKMQEAHTQQIRRLHNLRRFLIYCKPRTSSRARVRVRSRATCES